MYSIEYTHQALKDMGRLPAHIQDSIKKKLTHLAKAPLTAQNVKALTGEPGAYRLRVGDYRVVYYLEHDRLVIVVVKAQHRKDIYR